MGAPATLSGGCPTCRCTELVEQADAETLRLVASTRLLAAGTDRARRDLLEIDLGDREAVGEALHRRSAPGGACNLESGTGYSNREATEAARRVTGHPIPVGEEPRRPGDPAALVASSERIEAALGWRPRFPGVEEIVGSAWEWHRRHPDGYGAPAG